MVVGMEEICMGKGPIISSKHQERPAKSITQEKENLDLENGSLGLEKKLAIL